MNVSSTGKRSEVVPYNPEDHQKINEAEARDRRINRIKDLLKPQMKTGNVLDQMFITNKIRVAYSVEQQQNLLGAREASTHNIAPEKIAACLLRLENRILTFVNNKIENENRGHITTMYLHDKIEDKFICFVFIHNPRQHKEYYPPKVVLKTAYFMIHNKFTHELGLTTPTIYNRFVDQSPKLESGHLEEFEEACSLAEEENQREKEQARSTNYYYMNYYRIFA